MNTITRIAGAMPADALESFALARCLERLAATLERRNADAAAHLADAAGELRAAAMNTDTAPAGEINIADVREILDAARRQAADLGTRADARNAADYCRALDAIERAVAEL